MRSKFFAWPKRFGGGGGYYGHNRWGGYAGPGIGVGTIVIIVVIYLLLAGTGGIHWRGF